MEMRSIDVVSISPLLVGSGIATRKQKERPFASLFASLIGSCIATVMRYGHLRRGRRRFSPLLIGSCIATTLVQLAGDLAAMLFQSPTHRVMHCNRRWHKTAKPWYIRVAATLITGQRNIFSRRWSFCIKPPSIFGN